MKNAGKKKTSVKHRTARSPRSKKMQGGENTLLKTSGVHSAFREKNLSGNVQRKSTANMFDQKKKSSKEEKNLA